MSLRKNYKNRCAFHKGDSSCPFAMPTDGIVEWDRKRQVVLAEHSTKHSTTFCQLSAVTGYYTGDKRLSKCEEAA